MSAHCWLFKLAGNKIYENQCIMRFSSLLFVFHFIAFPPLLTQGLILYQMGLGFVTIFLSQFSIAGNIGVSHCDWSISSFLIRNWWTDISFAKWYPLSLSLSALPLLFFLGHESHIFVTSFCCCPWPACPVSLVKWSHKWRAGLPFASKGWICQDTGGKILGDGQGQGRLKPQYFLPSE